MHTDYTDYELTGDIFEDRAHFIQSGRPSDHPYLIDPDGVYRTTESEPIEPLAIQVTQAQMDYVRRMAPVYEAQNRANIRAMLGG